MSNVLWANMLVNGEVESDESDKYAIYDHSEQLEELTKKLDVVSFVAMQDFTDMTFNLEEAELPEGIDSTDELMAKNGTWVSGLEAVEMHEKVIAHLTSNSTDLGFTDEIVKAILHELRESLRFAIKAKESEAKFNFSVVM